MACHRYYWVVIHWDYPKRTNLSNFLNLLRSNTPPPPPPPPTSLPIHSSQGHQLHSTYQASLIHRPCLASSSPNPFTFSTRHATHIAPLAVPRSHTIATIGATQYVVHAYMSCHVLRLSNFSSAPCRHLQQHLCNPCCARAHPLWKYLSTMM
jgi:hypothetical protein